MSLKINYQKNLVIKSSANLVLFCNEKFTIDNFKKYPERRLKIKFKSNYLYKFLKKNKYENRE